MNSQKQFSYRLLKLFPVSVLKDCFTNIKGKKQEEIIEELCVDYNYSTLQDFAVNNFLFTKQHIQLCSHKLSQQEAQDIDFFGIKPYSKKNSKGIVEKFYFLDIPYTILAINKSNLVTHNIIFKQPVKVEITSRGTETINVVRNIRFI
jgi:hypothetical protein